uniref:ATP synthase F0 subunit 8 n=1 Tax=Sinanodonta woodiana TaxID=1069815 RepID=A0A346HGW8_SINWO|nr:ATP synthase F0 subunit 8 [Sinanodonta woodiana]AXO78654.1 ATP synthase F0 subunit 8 [Sinanodonta woodiana]
MPQLSPISWISVFSFFFMMCVNMSVINWWSFFSDYCVDGISTNKVMHRSRVFIWGKTFKKF